MRYKCVICEYVYDETVGAPEDGIPPGTRFNDIPGDWVCPLCGIDKTYFEEHHD